MYRIMVVDDEIYVADSLRDFISQASYLEYDVYSVYSGKEALELMERNNFDILVSDIRMPDIDGLFLMNKVKELQPSCRIIIISGYDNFDYIYASLKSGAFSYILKNEVYELVNETIKQAIADIKREFQKAFGQSTSNLISDPVDGLRYTAIDQFLNGDIDSDHLINRLSKLSFPLNLSYAIYPVLVQFSLQGNLVSDLNQRLQLCQKISATKELLFDNHYSVFCVAVKPRFVLLLIQDISPDKNDDMKIYKRYVERLQIALINYLSTDIDLVAMNSLVDLCLLSDIIDKMKNSIYKLSYVGGSIAYITNKAANEKQLKKDTLPPDSEPAFLATTKIDTIFDNESIDESLALFDEFRKYADKCSSMHCTPVIDIYMRIAAKISEYIAAHQLGQILESQLPLYKLFRINEFKSWNEAIMYLECLWQTSIELKKSLHKNDNIVEQIKSYVCSNIQQDLSLITIARHAGYNSSYISRYFHKETGETLSKYIVDKRIEYACSLLADTNLKINKVADYMGFSSANYFHSFFRKATGMTPQSYRDSLT